MADGPVLIIGSRYGQALADELAARNVSSMVIDIPSDIDGSHGGELKDAAEQLSIFDQSVSAVVHLAALERSGPEVDWALLDAAKRFQRDLQANAVNGGACFLGVTQLGGGFGFEHRLDGFDPWHGLVTGFCKSLAHEWPDVRVRAVDIDDRAIVDAARIIADELHCSDSLIEVGHVGKSRTTPNLVAADKPRSSDSIGIGEGDVLLVTGGARGITATITQSIAHLRPHVVLLGRTTPQQEEVAYSGLEAADLRRAILARRQDQGEDASLKSVNLEFDQVERNREVQANLDRLTAAGATVEYVVCDMRNGSDVAAVVKDVRTRLGRIDGVIHGAGVIEDKLVGDKTPESYQRVVATKAHGIMNLLGEIDFNETRLVVLFSSVSGRFGNAGQTDYAAASEVLNKMAQKIEATTAARVTSINWGPWLSGGMVSAEVERQFAERGVKLIRPEVGCQLFADELRAWSPTFVEVVVGGADGLEADVLEADGDVDVAERRLDGDTDAAEPRLGILFDVTSQSRDGDRLEIVRPMALSTDPYLIDHSLDGTPVVPFMTCTELLGATASLARPDLTVRLVEEVSLNKGFMLEADKGGICDIRARVQPVPGSAGTGDSASFSATLDANEPGNKRLNYAATVHLGQRRAPSPAPAPLRDGRPMSHTVEQCYDELLFHGPMFARILEITSISEEGVSAIARSTRPQGNLAGVGADAQWLFDPILLDAALQCLVIYCRVFWNSTPLPSRLTSLELFGDGPGITGSTDEVDVGLEIRALPSGALRVMADLYFVVDGEVRALATHFQGYTSTALNRLASA